MSIFFDFDDFDDEVRVYCPVCKTNKDHLNPCAPITVNLLSSDTAEQVSLKTINAIDPAGIIDGECEDITNKRALPKPEGE